jgi:hypothetical protein
VWIITVILLLQERKLTKKVLVKFRYVSNKMLHRSRTMPHILLRGTLRPYSPLTLMNDLVSQTFYFLIYKMRRMSIKISLREGLGLHEEHESFPKKTKNITGKIIWALGNIQKTWETFILGRTC